MTKYISTRGGGEPLSFTDVLLAGLAPDGGLYVPENWPKVDFSKLAGKHYTDVAFEVLKPFVGDDIPEDDLMAMIVEVYENNFTHSVVAPMVQVGSNTFILELFHGPTLAFKDYALQLVGRLFDYMLEKKGQRVTIVGATSGDTGSAAIEGCKACENIDIFILHPKGRTSEVQRRQMTTIDSPNVHNIALDGNFDDCQHMVKEMFGDAAFRNDMNLSAVNSINWARIAAQIVYYATSALALGAPARKVSFAVPTGNFGNVYAAWCAKQIGLPIEKLVIGSNRNDILTRFFETGEMTKGEVEPSLSPSMDIQVSSNFERYLFELHGRDSKKIGILMDRFKTEGSFKVDEKLMTKARTEFESRRCNDDQTTRMMAECNRETGYLIDPHTAVGLHAAWQGERDITMPIVALACAHPAKFPDAVQKATGIAPPLPAHLSDLYERKEIVTNLPNDLVKVQDFIREKVSR